MFEYFRNHEYLFIRRAGKSKSSVFGISQEDPIQVVPMESNHSLVAHLPDSECVTHPVQNYLLNSCLTNLVMFN